MNRSTAPNLQRATDLTVNGANRQADGDQTADQSKSRGRVGRNTSPLLKAGQGRVSSDIWEAALCCTISLVVSLIAVLVGLILWWTK